MVSKNKLVTSSRLQLSFSDSRTCTVCIGSGTLSEAEVWSSLSGATRIVVVTNETVHDLYAAQLRRMLPVEPDFVHIGDGEQYKTLDSFTNIMDSLIAMEHDRSSTLIALGGGVIGDVAGFVAATYQRGIGLVQVPTTLLAQVDSSIGGKTAVNHERGKNLIGAFYQPKLVVIDTQTLSSLPQRVYIEGLAEVVKYGIIRDAEFFIWMEQNVDRLLNRNQTTLAHAVRRSCELKSQIVESDEKESNLRLILNYGHTFGHGIENAEGYGSLLHGEAVAIGMVLAADLSVRMGLLSTSVARRIEHLLQNLELPTRLPKKASIERVFSAMKRDKKTVGKQQRHILVRDIGSVSVETEIEPVDVQKTLENRTSH